MKKSILVVVVALICTTAIAQSNVVTWSTASTKKAANLYEVVITAVIKEGYHLYAQNPGAQGPLPTSFTFSKNPLLTLEGKPKEKGALISRFESAWGGIVHYYEKTVSFVQLVRIKGKVKTNLSGKVEFIVCNQDQCLPPAEVEFRILLD